MRSRASSVVQSCRGVVIGPASTAPTPGCKSGPIGWIGLSVSRDGDGIMARCSSRPGHRASSTGSVPTTGGGSRGPSTPSAPRAPRRRRRRGLVRLQRLPRPVHAPRGASPRPTTRIDRWGTGASASRLVVGSRPVPRRPRGRAVPSGRGPSARVLFPTGYAANLGVLSALGGPGRASSCSDERNHASIIDGCRLSRAARWPSTRHGDLEPRRRRSWPAPPADRRHRGHRRRVLDGRRRGPGRRAGSRSAPATARCWCSTRPTPCSGRDADPAPTASTLLRVGTLSKALGALGGVRRRPGAAGRPAGQPGPARSSSPPPPTPADAAAAARRGRRRALGARATPCVARLRRLRRPARARATRRPSCPVVLGDEARALDGRPTPCSTRGCSCPAIRPPTVAPGTSPAARRPVGRAHRRPGRRASLAGPRPSSGARPWPAGAPRDAARDRLVVRASARAPRSARPGCAARLLDGAAGRGPRRSRPASRRSRSSPTTASPPTPPCSPRPPARTPTAVCPQHRWYPVPDGPADGRRRPRSARPHPRRGRSTSCAGRPAPTVGSGRDRRRGPVADHRTTPTAATWSGSWQPDVVLLVADAGLGTIDRRPACAVDRPRPAPHRSWSSTASIPPTTSTAATAAWLADRDGLDVVTDIAELADRLAP